MLGRCGDGVMLAFLAVTLITKITRFLILDSENRLAVVTSLLYEAE